MVYDIFWFILEYLDPFVTEIDLQQTKFER